MSMVSYRVVVESPTCESESKSESSNAKSESKSESPCGLPESLLLIDAPYIDVCRSNGWSNHTTRMSGKNGCVIHVYGYRNKAG